ncbi:MAG TPA: hypothetical protein VMB73_11695 [Acetobacteraceae bacterium]|nr:hypothetical protein [Acetobacteraceae bacterium]
MAILANQLHGLARETSESVGFNNFNTIDVAAGSSWSLGGDPKTANALLVSGTGTLNLAQGMVVEHGSMMASTAYPSRRNITNTVI